MGERGYSKREGFVDACPIDQWASELASKPSLFQKRVFSCQDFGYREIGAVVTLLVCVCVLFETARFH